MPALICGSFAFDTIMNFPGRFAEQILPDQLHILNASFLVPDLRRDFGGCAGNIAYALKLLGGTPLPMATLGSDGADYLARLKTQGISTEFVRQVADAYTAQAMIMTDRDNNQITAFHPGAMMQAHINTIAPRPDIRIGIISPDGRDAMLQHAQQFKAAGIPFVFDPGQGLPMFNGDELIRFIDQASWVTVNDYEGKMLCERTGLSCADISQRVHGLVVTLGHEGCEVWVGGDRTHVARPWMTDDFWVDIRTTVDSLSCSLSRLRKRVGVRAVASHKTSVIRHGPHPGSLHKDRGGKGICQASEAVVYVV